MDQPLDRRPGHAAVLRIALALFVLAWIFGPYALRSTVPVWIVFLVALGLEIHFFLGAFRPGWPRLPDRGPQAVDRVRYGYPEHVEDPYDELDDEDEEEQEEQEEQEESAGPEPAAAAAPRRVPLPVRRFVTGLGVIAALAVVVWVVEARTGWGALSPEARAAAEARFSEEASRIAGKPVRIRCDESGTHVGAVQHADGAAIVGGDLAYLTPERCLDLYRLAFRGEVRGSRTGRAIAVLAHEAWHLYGIRDEGRTECNALRSGVELGQRLGLPADEARRLMRQQRAENPLHARGSPQYLLPADC